MSRKRSSTASENSGAELLEELGEPVGEPPSESADRSPTEQTVEAWRVAKQTPAWLHAAAKTMHRWPEGLLLGEAAYDEAVTAAGSIRIGGHATYPLPRRPARRK